MTKFKTMQTMLDNGISTRRGIMCSHREPAYRDSALGALPRSERAQDHCVLLPLYPQMTVSEQGRVVAALAAACKPPIRESADQPG